MTKLRILIAMGLMLPFVAVGNGAEIATISKESAAFADTSTASSDEYKCCWTYYQGQWWCIPC